MLLQKKSSQLKIGRQAFEDALFTRNASHKLHLMVSAVANEDRLDVFFIGVICLNLMVIGIEMEQGEGNEMAFLYVEIAFLVAFIFELIYRSGLLRYCLSRCGREPPTAPEPKSDLDLVDIEGVEEQKAVEELLKAEETQRANQRKKTILKIKKERTEQLEQLQKNGSTWWPMFLQVCWFVESEKVGWMLWMFFDALIITISLVDVIVVISNMNDEGGQATTGNISSIRALRLLRVGRTVKLVRYSRSLWLLIVGLKEAVKTITMVGFLLGLIIYFFAILLCTNVKGAAFEDNPAREYFETLWMGIFTLFSIMTLEGWNEIAGHFMQVNQAWALVFMLYVVITHFVIMNLVVGVLVEHIQHMSTTSDLDLMKEVREKQHKIFINLHQIFKAADENGDMTLSVQEFKDVMVKNPTVIDTLEELGINQSEIDWLFETLDSDGSGSLSIDEFVEGVLRCKESELARQLMATQYSLIREFRSLSRFWMDDEMIEQQKKQIGIQRSSTSLQIEEILNSNNFPSQNVLQSTKFKKLTLIDQLRMHLKFEVSQSMEKIKQDMKKDMKIEMQQAITDGFNQLKLELIPILMNAKKN